MPLTSLASSPTTNLAYLTSSNDTIEEKLLKIEETKTAKTSPWLIGIVTVMFVILVIIVLIYLSKKFYNERALSKQPVSYNVSTLND